MVGQLGLINLFVTTGTYPWKTRIYIKQNVIWRFCCFPSKPLQFINCHCFWLRKWLIRLICLINLTNQPFLWWQHNGTYVFKVKKIPPILYIVHDILVDFYRTICIFVRVCGFKWSIVPFNVQNYTIVKVKGFQYCEVAI